MNIGSFTVEILSEGRFDFFEDGHINRSPHTVSSKPNDSKFDKTISFGINPVLVQTSNHNILLDTGLGWGLDAGTPNMEVSNVCTNLRIFGIRKEDITHVVLSHLHYDHAAGASFTDATASVQATFPNAVYHVHHKEWEWALNQQQNAQLSFGEYYRLDDFYKLISNGQVNFLTGHSTELIEGLTVMLTGGHTPGHQVAILQSGGEKAYYIGDLLPTEFQLNSYEMEKADIHPLDAKREKIQLLKQAHQEKALLLFYHSKNGQAGHLLKDEDQKFILAKQLPL